MLAVLEPATEAVLAELPRAGPDDADAAVARAKAAYPAWRAVAPPDRARLLYRLADALAERQEELAVLEARNAGKPIGDARGEMGMVVETFRYYAGGPERLLGDTIPVAGGGSSVSAGASSTMPAPSSHSIVRTGPVNVFLALTSHQTPTAMNSAPTISGA